MKGNTSSYEADDTGAVYLPSLKRALQGTPWQYCALRQFYEPTKEIMQVSTYLRVYRRYPKLIEHLVKVGFEHIVADIVYRHGMGPEIDDTQKRTHRILRVNKEDLSMDNITLTNKCTQQKKHKKKNIND